MLNAFEQLRWSPSVHIDVKWATSRMVRCLGAKTSFCIYANGTCVVAESPRELSQANCDRKLLSVVRGRPDFRVRTMQDGDFLVGFRGPVLSIVSGQVLRGNRQVLSAEALAEGLLTGEKFVVPTTSGGDDLDFLAGLYSRANLFQDARQPVIVEKWTPRAGS